MAITQNAAHNKDMRLISWITAVGIALLAITVVWLFLSGWDWQIFLEWKRQVGIIPFFAGLAILPLIGIPTTPLFIIAGATFGLTTALSGSAISIALNVALSYWLARYVLKQPLIKLLRRWNYDLPQFTPGKALSFLIVMRLAPGLPAFLKNYSTALFDVPFGIYLVISWFITFLYALSLIVLGDSLYNGDLREGAAGLGLLVAVSVAFIWLNKRQQRILDSGSEDQINALKNTLTESTSVLGYKTLPLRLLKMIAVLALLWGVLAQNAGWAFASEVIIAAVLASMFFSMLAPGRFSLSGLFLFACYFVAEALRGGFDVAWRALQPRLPIAPGWMNYTLSVPVGSPRVLFLNSVSLLPGTLSATLNGNIVAIHSLNHSADNNAELRRLEYWVMRVFAAPEKVI